MWQATTIDEYSRVRAANIGATAATWGYNTTTNLLSQIKGTGVQQYDYDFSGTTRNLTSRTNTLKSKTESFGYDTENLDKLVSVTGTSAQTIGYNATIKGNIETKTDAGTYTYDPARKYAVKTITNGLNISTTAQNIVYNAFNKVKTITEGTKTADFVYNADRQRISMTLKTSGATTKTRYYFGGSCEREVVGATTTQYIWIGGNAYTAVAVATKVGTGSWTVYNIFRDHLGTITHLKTGSTITEFSFDAWGSRRDKDDWSYTLTSEPALFADRGFTAHEFLADFNLYNMNGRLYDPVVGRFLSPDPFVQNPSFSQSYNRYSYCLNNPLKFTDYSGEKWKWNYLNPFYHFQNFMQWVNDKTPRLRQNMVNAGVPNFGVKYNTTFGTGFSVGENPANYPGYENRIVKGQQGISNQIAGFSGGDIGTGLSLFGEGMWVIGENRSISLYQQGFRKGVNGNYKLVGRNLSLFGDQPMTSATKPLSSFTTLGRGLSNLGTGLGVAGVAIDTYDYAQGNLSGTRYSYHLTGTGAAFGAAYFLGGPIGAATGGIFFLGEKAWDSFQPVWNDIVTQYWQFENAMNNGWRPR